MPHPAPRSAFPDDVFRPVQAAQPEVSLGGGPMRINSESHTQMSAAGDSKGSASSPMRLLFDAGTLVVEGLPAEPDPGLPGVKFDMRTRQFRAEAIWYRSIVEHVRKTKQVYA